MKKSRFTLIELLVNGTAAGTFPNGHSLCITLTNRAYHAFRHNKKAGVLFVDNHVDYLGYTEVPVSDTKANDPGFYYKNSY